MTAKHDPPDNIGTNNVLITNVVNKPFTDSQEIGKTNSSALLKHIHASIPKQLSLTDLLEIY